MKNLETSWKTRRVGRSVYVCQMRRRGKGGGGGGLKGG